MPDHAPARLSGIGVSRGYAVGRALLLRRDLPQVNAYAVAASDQEAELARLEQALQAARSELAVSADRLTGAAAADVAAIIDTHLLMLQDSSLTQAPATIIREQGCNAEWALKLQCDRLVATFAAMDDPYLRARQHDVIQVVARVQRRMQDDAGSQESLGGYRSGRTSSDRHRLQDCIVVADDLSPADTVSMQHQGVLAFITEAGGPLSHTAILARSLEIPAVVGVHNARRLLCDGQKLIVDGGEGLIYIDPDRPTRAAFRQRQRQQRRRRRALETLMGQPAITRDRVAVHLYANVELPAEADAARRAAADGVGLYRTEFLFMNRADRPSEEEQFAAYRSIVDTMAGRPVTIRTLDLGADKPSDTHNTPQMAGAGAGGPGSTNPALGLRAIRLCLHDPSLFMPQLRAILRASAFGPVRLLIPMLSNIQELDQTLALIDRAKRQLSEQRLKFDPRLAVGGMIEVPAAAVSAAYFARRLDFLSIGTNDLIQYALAIDRVDDTVNYLYDPLHPAVLLLINGVLEAGRRAAIPVSLCGEMASDSRYTRLLLGLGLTQFSTNPNNLLEVKQAVLDSHAGDLRALAGRLLDTADGDEFALLLTQIAGN